MSTRTSENWALVLGASSGFGAAVSVELARKGFDVCGVHLDRRSTIENAERTKAAVEEAGRRALFFNVNAADEKKRAEVVEALAAECSASSASGADGEGCVRLLFHSLAFGSLAPLVGEDAGSSARVSQVSMTLDVMASSLVYWTQELVWRGMLGRGSRVLAMTSAGSSRATAGYGMVSAAKAALESYVRQLALELAPRGITANAIRAGVTETAALKKIPGWESIRDRARAVNPGGRLTEPADVAAAVALIVEPGSQWISGNVLGVDGGEDVVG
ncbi:MAG: SDR family oxidoreductase [Myxococcales bacterium]|nr:MAG: SDR family oxidoreductase [Myxococcales bacterium]